MSDGNLATKVTFDLVVGLDPVAERDEVLVGQLVDAEVATDLGGLQGLQGAGLADAVDVGEGDLETLVTREINPNEACHQAVLPFVWSTPACVATPSTRRTCDVAEVSGVMRPRLPLIRSAVLITGASASDRGWIRRRSRRRICDHTF